MEDNKKRSRIPLQNLLFLKYLVMEGVHHPNKIEKLKKHATLKG